MKLETIRSAFHISELLQLKDDLIDVQFGEQIITASLTTEGYLILI